MSRLFAAVSFVVFFVPRTSELAAQNASAKIPIRQLGAIAAASSDTLGPQIAIRALPNGMVLVNDIIRRRVLLFDSTLKHSRIVLDSTQNSTTGGAPVQIPSAHLIRFTGDSTLYVDVSSQSLLVLDANGKVARVMALPKPQDVVFIAVGALYGTPVIDPQGRLIYRGQLRPRPADGPPRGGIPLPAQPDSGPIVRADFDTRKVDTVTTVKIFQPNKMSMSDADMLRINCH